ncbi:MAG TPA: HlyD family efflux transporter periplasmic adaptor subunit [Anaerolineales bacterium]|nr:HlyD family efflux transporter periplasmic adaptor subunit [Anaerolineales bacterium]
MKTKLLSFLLLIALFTTACGAEKTSTPVAEPDVDTVDLTTVTAEGKLLPASSVKLAFAQSGVVSEIFAEPGETLVAGDVIARLVGLEAAQAQLAAAQLELADAKKALNDLQKAGSTELALVAIDLKDTKEDYEDAVNYLAYLRREKKVPQTETKRYVIQNWRGYEYRIHTKHFKAPATEDMLIDAENDLALDKARMEDLQRQYDRLRGGVDAEQLPIFEARLNAAHANVRSAEAAIELYELRAPFDGVLLSLDLDVGESVAPTLPVAFFADTSAWIVETKDLAEIDVANVVVGDPAVVKLDAFPGEEFKGTVIEIDPVGREYLGDMTYKVTVALDEADVRFLWNMTATVNIE